MRFRGIVAASSANATCAGASSNLFRQAVQTTLSLQLRSWFALLEGAFTLAITPPRSSKTLSTMCMMSRSCVTTMRVLRWFRHVRHNKAITFCAFSSPRFPVGSSARTRSGSFARARAMATRCCSPPLNCAGVCAPRSTRPTVSRSSNARSRSIRPFGIIGSRTFSRAVSCGSRL